MNSETSVEYSICLPCIWGRAQILCFLSPPGCFAVASRCLIVQAICLSQGPRSRQSNLGQRLHSLLCTRCCWEPSRQILKALYYRPSLGLDRFMRWSFALMITALSRDAVSLSLLPRSLSVLLCTFSLSLWMNVENSGHTLIWLSHLVDRLSTVASYS